MTQSVYLGEFKFRMPILIAKINFRTTWCTGNPGSCSRSCCWSWSWVWKRSCRAHLLDEKSVTSRAGNSGQIQVQMDEQVDRQVTEWATTAAGGWAEPKRQEYPGSPQSSPCILQVSGDRLISMASKSQVLIPRWSSGEGLTPSFWYGCCVLGSTFFFFFG